MYNCLGVNRRSIVKIDISEVVRSVNKIIMKEVELTFSSFQSRLGDFPILQKQPVSLRIENQEGKNILISGTVTLEMGIPCSRCLEEVPTSIHFEFDKKLSIADNSLTDEEMDENNYLIGFEMDVDKLVYAEILVNWPMKVLCKDDCEGICKVCGTNLNRGACDCQRTELDPRMAAIQDIFNKFKEV